MNAQQKRDVINELRKLVDLVLHDSVDGLVLIATHAANNSATSIAVAPTGKLGVDKLMVTLDAMHFRMKTVCYLGPKGGAVTKLGASEPDMENPQ